MNRTQYEKIEVYKNIIDENTSSPSFIYGRNEIKYFNSTSGQEQM